MEFDVRPVVLSYPAPCASTCHTETASKSAPALGPRRGRLASGDRPIRRRGDGVSPRSRRCHRLRGVVTSHAQGGLPLGRMRVRDELVEISSAQFVTDRRRSRTQHTQDTAYSRPPTAPTRCADTTHRRRMRRTRPARGSRPPRAQPPPVRCSAGQPPPNSCTILPDDDLPTTPPLWH